MSDIKELCLRVNRSFNDAEKAADAASYQRVGTIFSDAEIQLREYIQDATKEEANRVIQKLESGREITKEELKFIRLWIVGDAEYYLKMENNFNDWLSELKRIVNEINKITDSKPDFETASHLRAILEDGRRVIYDVVFS